MEKMTRIRVLSLLVGICLVLVGGLGYYNWQLSRQLADIAARTEESGRQSPFIPGADIRPEYRNPWLEDWDPSGRFSDLQKRMNEMMSAMSPGYPNFNIQGFGFSQLSPEISLEETTDAYVVVVTVPQGQEVELNTELQGNQLKISGKVINTGKERAGGLFGQTGTVSTLTASRFSQTMTLPSDIEEAGMTMHQNESEITVRIPKAK